MVENVTLPVMRPLLPRQQRVAKWLLEMDERRTYSNRGPLVRELEARYASVLKVDPEQVIAVANATLGLAGAVSATKCPTWAVPDYTFPATALAVLQSGREILLCDVEEATGAMNPRWLPTGVGIMPVAPFGGGVELDEWSGHENVVLDAAASLGTLPDLGALPPGWAVVFSLHATKVLPAGEGGLVVLGSQDAARKLRAWINFGFSGARESALVGTNAKMSEIHAAYGLASLEDWPSEYQDWLDAHSLMRRATSVLPGGPFGRPTSAANPYWLQRFESVSQASRVERVFSQRGIETRRWWGHCIECRHFNILTSWGPAPSVRSWLTPLLGCRCFANSTQAKQSESRRRDVAPSPTGDDSRAYDWESMCQFVRPR